MRRPWRMELLLGWCLRMETIARDGLFFSGCLLSGAAWEKEENSCSFFDSWAHSFFRLFARRLSLYGGGLQSKSFSVSSVVALEEWVVACSFSTAFVHAFFFNGELQTTFVAVCSRFFAGGSMEGALWLFLITSVRPSSGLFLLVDCSRSFGWKWYRKQIIII